MKLPLTYSLQTRDIRDATGLFICSCYSADEGTAIVSAVNGAERMRELLTTLEWSDCGMCPSCHYSKEDGGHKSDCLIAAALKGTT